MRSPRGLRTDAESESEISADDDQSTEAGGISTPASHVGIPTSNRVALGAWHSDPIRHGR